MERNKRKKSCSDQPSSLTKKQKSESPLFASDLVEFEAYSSGAQGRRDYYEDRAVLKKEISSSDLPNSLKEVRAAFFAIFDGHGGVQSAEFMEQNLLSTIFGKITDFEKKLSNTSSILTPSAIKAAHVHAFLAADKQLSAILAKGDSLDGCTATTLLLLGNQLFAANVGDSSAILSRNGKCLPITKEHKPLYPAERKRIEAAGSFVSAEGRVEDALGVSRSFGDCKLKKCGVTAQPDVLTCIVNPAADRFLLLACDGFWDVFKKQEAFAFVTKQLEEGVSVDSLVERLIQEAIETKGGQDNVTILLIKFK
eukprot:GCRY01001734.1.p1 GENE.GCRY01001734.1~~GCRY01001734.1.p1  ORF type:complete len:310 (-),score=57.53 GCRY01001734.1:251-1180(-)